MLPEALKQSLKHDTTVVRSVIAAVWFSACIYKSCPIMSAVPELADVPKRLRPFVIQPDDADAPHSLTSQVKDGDVALLSSSLSIPLLKLDDDTNPNCGFKRYTPPVP